jgi:pimeloyl-ACP methyl ester carboxylesterase
MNTPLILGRMIDQKFPIRQLETKTGIVSYRESGVHNQDVLILLHGIGSSSGSWVAQLDYFSTDYRVIAWDLPGYGVSTSLVQKKPTAQDYAASLVNFVDALGIRPNILIGHSLGALIAGSYAAHGGVVGRALVLASPANGYGSSDETKRNTKLSERLDNMDRLGPHNLAIERAPALVSPEASEEAVELVRWNMSRLTVEGHAQAAHMLASGNLMCDASLYHGSVLVNCGSADFITAEAKCEEIANAFSNSEYHTLHGVGHASYIENPESFIESIVSFVAGLDA